MPMANEGLEESPTKPVIILVGVRPNIYIEGMIYLMGNEPIDKRKHVSLTLKFIEVSTIPP